MGKMIYTVSLSVGDTVCFMISNGIHVYQKSKSTQ